MKTSLPYVIARPLAGGGFAFHFQPSSRLRANGIRPVALGTGARADDPPEHVRLAARRQLDALRAGAADGNTGKPARAAAPKPAKAGAYGPTFAELVEQVKAQRRFQARQAATQRAYGVYLAPLLAWAGAEPARFITREAVQALYDEIAATRPALAGQMVMAGAMVIGRHLAGLAPHARFANPFQGLDTEPFRKRSVVLPEAAIAHLVAAADALGHHGLGNAILLQTYLAQRPSDVIKLPRRAWRPDPATGRMRFWIDQQKTGALVLVPEFSSLAERLAAHPPAGLHNVVEWRPGKPYTLNLLERHWADARALAATGSNQRGLRPWSAVWAAAIAAEPELALTHLPTRALADPGYDLATPPDMVAMQMRDLRRTGIVRLLRAGCSTREIASISGHSETTVHKMMEVYGPVDTRMAESAIAKLEAANRQR